MKTPFRAFIYRKKGWYLMTHKQHEADIRAEQYLNIERSLATHTHRAQAVLLFLCALLLVGFGLALCLAPHRDFSPEENRTLTTAPTFSVSALVDGTLTRSLSDFCADQFPFRSQFVGVKAGVELLLGKQENDGVLYGTDDYLISRLEYTAQHRRSLEQNLVAVDRFEEAVTEHGILFTFAVVPRSIDVNVTKLPPLYDTANADAVWSWLTESCKKNQTAVTLLTEPLRQAADEEAAVWFRTDHHWTTQGAYYAYTALAEQLGYEPYPLSDFTPQTVCNDFFGTTYAASGMHWMQGETLTLMRFDNDERFITEIIENGKVTRSFTGLYDMSAVETHDKYNVFLGGTNAHIRVSDPSETDRPTLVLLKDSFSQSLAPYLARHYDLVLLDPRTHKAASGSILDLALSYNPDRMLLLYGIDTLCQSPSLNVLSFGLH